MDIISTTWKPGEPLNRNQYVLFSNGDKQGYLEARWSSRHNAFYTIAEDEDGSHYRLYSTDVYEKPTRKKAAFVPTADNCPVRLDNITGETDKAYVVYIGDNGCIVPANRKVFYGYVAKSVCYVDDKGVVFCPVWAKP